MKTINLLGSTGSIGVQTLDVARAHDYKIEALAAFSDVKKIEDYLINPVDSRLADDKKPETLEIKTEVPGDIPVVDGFIAMDDSTLEEYKLSDILTDLFFFAKTTGTFINCAVAKAIGTPERTTS